MNQPVFFSHCFDIDRKYWIQLNCTFLRCNWDRYCPCDLYRSPRSALPYIKSSSFLHCIARVKEKKWIVRWNFMHTEYVALYEELCLSGVSVLHCIARVKEKKWIVRHNFMQTECVAPGFSEISAFHSHCLVGMHEVIGRLGMDDWINGQRMAVQWKSKPRDKFGE